MSGIELRELREGLVATVVGAGVDEFATNWLLKRISADPDALESVIRTTLNGSARLDALKSTGLMDAGPQPTLDAIATMTAEALAVPSAAVSLLSGDEQFLVGCTAASDAAERWRPLSMSICKFTVVSGIPFIVDNATTHPLLSDHPVVLSGEIGAYAGIPLFDAADQAIGTLCTWERRPRLWTRGQIMVLQDMADVAAAKIFGWPTA